MRGRQTIEMAILIAISAILYWLGFELQHLLFQFTEHLPGVNWFYLPAGLRVVLVLVTGISGALGIIAASALINFLHMQDMHGWLLLLTATASGLGAWVALWLLRLSGVIAAGLLGLTSSALLQFALVYALLNAMFHQSIWWLFKRDGTLLVVDIWPMFIGDLLGAIVFLYGLKLALTLKKPVLRKI
jgi:hypothetical protein